MATYEVEIEVASREVYVVEADSDVDAMKNWAEGRLLLQEVIGVEGVTGVQEVD